MAKDSKLRSLRMSAGLSQNALARKADLDRATVSAAENQKNVSDLSLAKIATALSVSVGEIDERA